MKQSRSTFFQTLACFWLGVLCLVLLCGSSQARENGARVVVVLADYASLHDFAKSGLNVRSLMHDGGFGLVNTGTRWTAPPHVAYISLGTGSRWAGSTLYTKFYDSDETVGLQKAGDRYSVETGNDAPSGSAVCLGLARMLKEDKGKLVSMHSVGLIGDAFHQAGLRTAVIGNSDVWSADPNAFKEPDSRDPNSPLPRHMQASLPGNIGPRMLVDSIQKRYAPFVAMDSHGIVDFGAIGAQGVDVNPNAPAGIEDNLDKIAKLTISSMKDHGLVVVELGDLARIESMRSKLSPGAYHYYRYRALGKLDLFIGRIRPEIEKRGCVLVVYSPHRQISDVGYRSNLAPMIIFGPGISPGVLSSPTTRAAGLIANVDFAPTVLQYAGLPMPSFLSGRPASTVFVNDPMSRINRLDEIGSRNYALQIPVLACIGIISLLAVAAAEVTLRWFKKDRRLRNGIGWLLLLVISLPAAMLLADGLGDLSALSYVKGLVIAVGLVLALCSIIKFIAGRFGLQHSLLAIILAVTSILCLSDVIGGARLLRWSILSCDQITAIRSYGIGNEYMGIVIATAMLSPLLMVRAWLASKLPMPSKPERTVLFVAAGVWFAAVCIVIGYPSLGASVGGLVTAIAALGPAFILLIGKKLNFWHSVLLAALSCAIVLAFTVVDTKLLAGHASHLGRTAVLTHSYGWGYPFALAFGKLAMHLAIIESPQAVIPLMVGAVLMVLFVRREKREQDSGSPTSIMTRVGLPAVIIGVVAALLFNDSGVVPAGLMLAYYVMSMLYIRLKEFAA